MPVGICKLCLQNRVLEDSHLLPAALWFAHYYGWDNLFNLFLMTSLIAAAIVAPRWNDGPRELPDSSPLLA